MHFQADSRRIRSRPPPNLITPRTTFPFSDGEWGDCNRADFKRLFTISEYYDRDRTAFYKAIQGVREQGMDMTGWIEYFTEGLATQMREVQERGERVIKVDIQTRRHDLNERQRRALRHVLETGSLNIQEFEGLCKGVIRRTLQRDLQGLVKIGLLVSEGATTSLKYRLGKSV